MTSLRAVTAMAVLEAMDAARIEYVALRGHESISVEPGRDIDLVADMRFRPEIERILHEARKSLGWDCLVRCRGHHVGTSCYFVGPPRDGSGPEQLEMHFTQVRWAGATVLGTAQLIERRQRAESGVWSVAPEHLVVQRVIQTGLSNNLGTIRDSYWDELVDICRSHTERVVSALSSVLDDEAVSRQVVAALIAEDRATTESLVPAMRRRFLLARGGRARLREVPAMVGFALGKNRRPRRSELCGVVARVDSRTSEDVVTRLERSLSHMFVQTHHVDLDAVGRDEFKRQAARVVSHARLMIVRADEPFGREFGWISRVATWIPPDQPDAGVDLVVRRFLANHEFLR